MLALGGHKPTRADALPPFKALYPLLAEALGLLDADADARNMMRTLESLSAAESTRVDAP